MKLFLGFAGRNKYGKKEELLARALELAKIRSSPLQSKIRELFKASQASQEVAEMMGPNGQPINPYGKGKIEKHLLSRDFLKTVSLRKFK